MPVTTLFFLKDLLQYLRTSWKELIWCTNYPNAHISTSCKRWSFIWWYFFPMSIIKCYTSSNATIYTARFFLKKISLMPDVHLDVLFLFFFRLKLLIQPRPRLCQLSAAFDKLLHPKLVSKAESCGCKSYNYNKFKCSSDNYRSSIIAFLNN